MKLRSTLSNRKNRKRIISVSLIALLLFITGFNDFGRDFFSLASAYTLKEDNNVDGDSNIDAVANIGTDGTTSYLDAQSKDGTYQNITEADNAVLHDFEDPHDAIIDSQSPVNIGTYSDDSAMNTKDSTNNTLTEGVGDGATIAENVTDPWDVNTTNIDSYGDIGTDSNEDNSKDNDTDSLYMTMQESNQGGAGGQLNSTKDTVASDTTTSATYEDVDGLTASLTFSYTSDVLLFASIQATGSTAAKGGWRLVFDSTNYLDLERQIGTEPGNIMLVDLVTSKTAGTYTFKVQHQIDGGTLTTANAIIVAVALHDGFGSVPANSSYVASDTVGTSWSDITGLSTEITLSSTSHIVAIMVMNGYHSGNNKDGDFAINIDSTRMEVHDRDWSASNEYGCVSIITRTDSAKTPGTYIVKGEWRGSGGSTLTGEDFKLVVIAAESNSGANSIDVQKNVVTSDSTIVTSIENITGLLVTSSVADTSHVLAIMTTSTDSSLSSTSAYTTINIGGTDYDVMERGHPSAQRWGSVGQVIRTDSTVSTNQEVYGRWYTDSGNTLTGGNIVLVSIVLYAGGDDYELDLEYQFTSVDFDNTYEYLCTYIQIATVNGDNLQAYEWTGSTWASLGSLTSDTWNNFTLTYLTSATYYIKFNDSDQEYETTQSTFNLDAIFLRTSNDNNNDYEFDREFSFTNLNTTDLNEELVIYTGDTLDTESLKVYVWNGTDWKEIATISTGQTNTWVNISISSELDSSTEYFSFRDTDQVLDSSQGIWEINYVAIHTWGVLSDYELQWEHQAQGVDPDKNSYNITIFGYDPPEYPTGEILELRGQSYRHWYNADTETFTYRSDYLVQKKDIHSETDWVTYDEYPIRFILRLNNGTIKTFESAIQITNYIGLIDNSTIWGVAIESFNGVMGFYMNFAENWGHGQMLYYPRLLDGTLSLYTQPLYAIYYRLYANYGGTWYDQLLNNRTLYDAQSNPRNNLRFSNTSDIFQIEFNTNNIDILSSNWNFTHGFKYNITEKRFHPINKVVCNNRDFDDIGFGYEITYTPMAETNYKLDRFILQNSTNFITVDATTAWQAGTYLDNYLAKVIIIAENGQTFNFYFDDMINAGFINNYLELHEITLPNGIVRKTLLAGMYGYGSYTQGTWIEIDPIFSEKQVVDEYDFNGYYDYSSTYVVLTGSIELDMGESAEPRMYNSTLTFDLGITGYISTITNVNMTVYLVSASQLELDEYIGLALYFNSTLTGGFWNETYVTGKAKTWTMQDYYWANYSFIPGDLPSGNTTFTDADMRPILNQWLTHHNTDPVNRQYINFKLFPGTNTDVGTNDNMRIYDAQMGTESLRTTLTIEYELYEPVMVEVWNNTASAWDLASTTTSNITNTEQWYNYTISADYVDGSNQITWRYRDVESVLDAIQDVLHIDYAGVTAWNFTINEWDSTVNNVDYETASGWELFDSMPFTFNVTSGVNFTIQIRGVDGAWSPVSNEYLRFNIVNNPTTGTNLSTTYQPIFINQAAGDQVQLTFYLWCAVPFGIGDETMTFTLRLGIIET